MAVATLKNIAKRKRHGAGRPAACDVAGRMENLLDIATKVFLEYGYKNTNLSEVAHRAGASKRTIYARYSSKADLFIAIVTRKIGEMQEIHAKTLVLNEPLAKVLGEFGTSFVRSMLRPELRALFQVIAAESPEFPELATAFWNLGPKRLVAMLEEYLAVHPEFAGDRPEHAAEMFLSLCWGLSILKRQFDKDYVMPTEKRRLNVEEAVRIFVAAYTSPAPHSGGQAVRNEEDDGHGCGVGVPVTISS